MSKKLLLILFSFCTYGILSAQHQIGYKTSSVLASGAWYKLSTQKTGVYKIDASDLEAMGIDYKSININNLGVFSNFGGIVAEEINKNEKSDLFEIPIKIIGGDDGQFDQEDYILFYNEGADKWHLDLGSLQYNFEKNIYDHSNYCFLTIDQGNNKMIEDDDLIIEEPQHSSNNFDDNQVYEEDAVNLLAADGNVNTQGSGKLWFGNNFGANSSFSISNFFDLRGWISNQSIHIKALVAGRSASSGGLTLSIGDEDINKNVGSSHVTEIETNYARLIKYDEKINLTLLPDSEISLYYENSSNLAKAWLDNLKISGKRLLKYYENQMHFSNLDSEPYQTSEFIINENSTSDLMVWNVSDIQNTTNIKLESSAFKYLTENTVQQFVIFKIKDAFSTTFLAKIENQNLHAIDDVDYLIVYHNEYKQAAERLAAHRRSHDNLNVISVDLDQVLNEFSSGKFDPSAIRNFAKMLFDRSPNFRYLGLLGDGSYDQRQLFNTTTKQSLLPIFETAESIHPVEAFPSDDFFALLNDGEGGDLVGKLDIAVGRMPVKSADEANVVIDKIIRYDVSPDRFGFWKTDMGFIADDEDNNLHLNQTERIADMTESKYPFVNIDKIYFDAYKQESTPGGQRYPEANKAIKDNIFKGQLAMCYLGHGGRNGISQERVLQIPDIKSFQNPTKPTLFITATCSLTGYDNHNFVSAGEEAFLKPFGGAIALFTTVRAVYSSSNERLTRAVFDNIYNKEYNKSLRLGDIIVAAKNANASDTLRTNARKFTLIGDPAQRLGTPEYGISLLEINNTPVNIFRDTIGAFDVIKLRGVITDYMGRKVTDFNGITNIKFFDKKTVIETRANDTKSKKVKFEQFKNLLFSGQTAVVDGFFELEFTIPLDINYNIGSTKLSMYAYSESTDAVGNYNKIMVGGVGKNMVLDDQNPEIDVYINNTSFRSGGIANKSPNLLVTLSDDTGINITGNSIGHDITARLEGGNLTKTFTLNSYFESNKDDITRGSILFPLGDLEEGDYNLTVKAWDLANNNVSGTIDFTVVNDGYDDLLKVYNFPNPFSQKTFFNFEHNIGFANTSTKIEIFDLNGRLIKTISDNSINNGNANDTLFWDTSDNNGNKVAQGVYFYKINLDSPSLGRKLESKFHKLILF